MSIDIGGSANASVGAGASIGGGIGGTLAGALGGSLSAGISVAGGLALSAAASFAANLNLSAGFSASFGASTVTPGTRPPDIYPAFMFRVQFQGIRSPLRFHSIGQIHATQNKPPPPIQKDSNSGKGKPAPKPAPSVPPTSVAQSGQGGASTRLPGIGWSWDELTLKRGIAPDGIELLLWIQTWWTNPQKALPKNLQIFMLDLMGNPAMTWSFKQTFPTEWTLLEYKSDSAPGTLAFDTLKLAWAGTPELTLY